MSNENYREGNSDLLIRLDERIHAIQHDLDQLKQELKCVIADIDKEYTTKAEFSPIKSLVYGFVGFLLLSLGGMFMAVVVKTNDVTQKASTSAVHIIPQDQTK